jgi:hypothetical protein
MFWNVRPRPLAAIRCGASRPISCPNSATDPELSLYTPETQLSSAVLPAPLGPMMPNVSPVSTPKLTPSSAAIPPKRSTAPFTTSAASLMASPPGSA